MKIELTNEQLKTLFEAVKNTVAIDAARPILQYAKATVKDNTLTCVALDGYMLSRITLELAAAAPEPFTFYFRPFALPKGLVCATIEKTDDKVQFLLRCTEWSQSYIFPQPCGDFVDVERIFPQLDSELSISFNAARLISILKPFTKNGDRHHIVTFNFVRSGTGIAKTNAAVLTGKADKVNTEMLILPVRNN